MAVLALSRQLRALAAEQGLSPTQVSVLGLLDREQSLRASDIAVREGLNPTLVSRVLANLEAGGYIQRAREIGDGRAHAVTVTAAGHACAQQMRRRRSEWLQERLQYLKVEEVERLLAALPALRALSHPNTQVS